MGSKIIWVDTETTGLDLGSIPLEVSVAVTDSDLNVMGQFTTLVRVTDIDSAIMLADDFVVDMHTKNGLWDDLRKYGGTTPAQVDDGIIKFLTEHMGLESGECPMAGSTIDFDRRIARAFFPKLEKFCHYRSINVSGVKELCRRWAPTTFEIIKTRLDEENKAHRAKDDILASIMELEFYKDNFFKTELQR